jgi:hypothetical protein
MSVREALDELKARGVRAADLLHGDDATLRRVRYDSLVAKLGDAMSASPRKPTIMADLVGWYEYFDGDSSHVSILLADAAKRCWIELACEQVLAAPPSSAAVIEASDHLALSTSRLLSLRKADTSDFPGGDPSVSLALAAQAVWHTHGYTNVVDGILGWGVLLNVLRGEGDSLRPTAVLDANDAVALALRLLVTEQHRVVAFKGLAEFVSRGGDITALSPRDMRPFQKVFPGNDGMEFSFSPLGTRYLTPADLLQAAGRSTDRRKGPPHRLSDDVFE